MTVTSLHSAATASTPTATDLTQRVPPSHRSGWSGTGRLTARRIVALAGLASLAGPVWPTDAPPQPWKAEFTGPADSTFRVELHERIRGEFVDWFGDPVVNGNAIPKESTYNFVGNKFQLGVRAAKGPFEVFTQFQDTTIAALPENGVGIGAAYYAQTPHTTQQSAFLRQGYAKFKSDGFSITGGRQLYFDAGQGVARNKNLKWIQDFRWAQRLIGPFEYTHVGRSFDGGQLGYQTDDYEIGGFAFLPTYGGFEINGMHDISGINVAGLTANLKDSEAVGSTLGRVFWTYYSDTRGLVATDNRPAPVRAATRSDPIEIHTLGAAGAHLLPLGPGNLDGSFFGYGQVGKWQNLDQNAWAYGVELGYQFSEYWSAPWIRAGINSASGDPNPNDGEHQTFFQMLPTAWLYAQFPFYNMMNNQDVFLQAIFAPDPKVNLRVDFHWLTVNQSRDLVYSGSGATSNTYFGYNGAPTGGFDQLAYTAHMMLSVKPVDHVTVNLFYGHAFGQSILNAQYTGNQGNYGFVETVLAF
ncbi:alginate export family protein [Methylotetracoccus oryzae]|uniref:alginate export family protein n=1 Tax=Methylotetracoccus oryzae TaxID=1919059 RepID=UPI001F388BD8|nr:alginate export family protein [Methylotetracoccus oryzae]